MTTPNDNDRPGRSGALSGGSTSGESTSRQELRNEASAVADQAREAGMAQLDRHRGTAASEIDRLAESADAVAEALSEQDQTGLSHYLTDAARSMHEMADGLRNRNADELLREASRIARNNPGLFLAGSIAIGFGLSRLARASAQHDHSRDTSTSGLYSGADSSMAGRGTTTTGSPWPQSRAGVTGYDASVPESDIPPLHTDESPLPGYGASPYPNNDPSLVGRNGAGRTTGARSGDGGRDSIGGTKQ